MPNVHQIFPSQFLKGSEMEADEYPIMITHCGPETVVNTKGESGDTALGFAVRLGRLDVIKVLLRAGACPGSRGKVKCLMTGGVGRSSCFAADSAGQVVADAQKC